MKLIEGEFVSAIPSRDVMYLEAVTVTSPAVIANYAYELAKEFNQYYHDTPILKEEDGKLLEFRLVLINTVAGVLVRAMDILGISLPDRM